MSGFLFKTIRIFLLIALGCLALAAVVVVLNPDPLIEILSQRSEPAKPQAADDVPQLAATETNQKAQRTEQVSAEDYRKRKAEERLQVEEETKRHSEEMLRGLEALAVAAVEPTTKAFPDLLSFDLGTLTASVGKTARLQDGEIWVNKRQITKTGGKVRAFEFSPGLGHLYVLLHVGFHEDWGIYPEGEKPPQVESLDLLIVGLKTRSLKRVFQNDCGFDVPGWWDSESIQFSPSSCAEAGPMLLLNLSTNQISILDEMDPNTRPAVRRSTKKQVLR